MLKQMAATREQPEVNRAIDESVIVACQHGDRDALRVLFEEYKDRVYSIALYSLSGNEAAAADVTQQELSEHVQAAIAELSPKLRLPILLKYIEGFSYEEIAAVLGCSKGTVASRLNRGHKALARRLDHLRGQFD